MIALADSNVTSSAIARGMLAFVSIAAYAVMYQTSDSDALVGKAGLETRSNAEGDRINVSTESQ